MNTQMTKVFEMTNNLSYLNFIDALNTLDIAHTEVS